MPKFKKKAYDIVDAWKWNGKTLNDAMVFCNDNGLPPFTLGGHGIDRYGGFILKASGVRMVASQGDYIVRDASGNYFPCKPAAFWATYDPA